MSKTAGAADGLSFADLRVLCVDDERDVLLGLTMLVESVGARARGVASGDEALAAAAAWAPHVVVSDVTMPGMSGLELLAELRRRQSAIRTILITGFGTIALAVEALRRGAAHFLTKPFENADLLEAVRFYGREALVEERVRSLTAASAADDGPAIVADDPAMKAVLDLVAQVAPTPMTVLIQGESGTGKELIARAIHAKSQGRERPFLAVNAAALPDTLLESELFGHKKGAFTGADRDRQGIFALAGGGTVFLDEIGLMSPAFQGKLLRVLQERTVIPLGTSHPLPVDFRLVTATSRSLRERIDRGEFREDLYYRLRVVTVDVPPLRERRADVPLLAGHFVARYAPLVSGRGGGQPRLSAQALAEISRHPWPGNVRELENCIQRALVLAGGGEVQARHLGLSEDDDPWRDGGAARDLPYEEGKQRAVESFQRRYVERALARSGGNVTRAAESCGLTRAAFQRIMRSLGVDRGEFAAKP